MIRFPTYSGVHLTGKLSGWATPKDLILHLAGKLTVRVSAFQLLPLYVSMIAGNREEQAAFWSILARPFSTSLAQVRSILLCYSACDWIFKSGLATIANMGAEVGATTSTFPYTPQMRAYLNATGRAPVARAADAAALEGFLSPDEGAEYDEVIEIVRS